MFSHVRTFKKAVCGAGWASSFDPQWAFCNKLHHEFFILFSECVRALHAGQALVLELHPAQGESHPGFKSLHPWASLALVTLHEM